MAKLMQHIPGADAILSIVRLQRSRPELKKHIRIQQEIIRDLLQKLPFEKQKGLTEEAERLRAQASSLKVSDDLRQLTKDIETLNHVIDAQARLVSKLEVLNINK